MQLRSKTFTVLALLGVILSSGFSVEPGNPVPLWEGEVPGEKGDVPAEKAEKGKDGIERTSNVSVPTMTVYHSPKGERNGAAVLVCPGGGYRILASEHKGSAVCEWLCENGVTAVLLTYRVPRREGLAKHQAPLQDAQRALGMIRTHAAEWGLDPQRIGVLGFSAGGHLAAMALSAPERSYPVDAKRDAVSCRPDFGILIYPAYLLDEKDPDKLASELAFNAESQPVFLAVASDDHWASSSARLAARSLLSAGGPERAIGTDRRAGKRGLTARNLLSAGGPERAIGSDRRAGKRGLPTCALFPETSTSRKATSARPPRISST